MFKFFNFKLIFPGEQTWKGLEPLVIEYFMRRSRGILHIGAHVGLEAEFYSKLGKPVLWIEANPEMMPMLYSNIARFEDQQALNMMISQEDSEKEFFITSNEVSSSALPLSDFGRVAWGIEGSHSIKVNSRSLDSFTKEFPINFYDFWVIDVQGLELSVLKGGVKSLASARFLLIECSLEKYYEHGVLYPEIRDFLESQRFYPILTQRDSHFEMLFVSANQD
jgi:FkbM family methyltransferase